jgi:hypothetical protein
MQIYSIHDQIVAGLQTLRLALPPIKRGKYSRLAVRVARGIGEDALIADAYYFVGSSGALRRGKTIADSLSLTDGDSYRRIRDAGRIALGIDKKQES